MCVGLAAKVVKVKGNIALVDASGARRQVSAELIENLDPGDYVMVHAGTAIAKISSDDIEDTTELLEDLSWRTWKEPNGSLCHIRGRRFALWRCAERIHTKSSGWVYANYSPLIWNWSPVPVVPYA